MATLCANVKLCKIYPLSCVSVTVVLPQTFALPASACIGQYLRVNLIGKRQRQQTDMRFYTAIWAVTAHGRAPHAPLPALSPWRLRALPRMQLHQARHHAGQA